MKFFHKILSVITSGDLDQAQHTVEPDLCPSCLQNYRQTIKSNKELISFEPVHEISNNVVCATSKGSDQPAHTRRLIQSFACCLNIL